MGHQLYAVAYKEGKGGLQFRIPTDLDLDGVAKAEEIIHKKMADGESLNLIPNIEIPYSHQVHERNATADLGLTHWHKFFNFRQLLALITYVEIIREATSKLEIEYEPEKVKAIVTYLALVLDRCADKNCKLTTWQASAATTRRASTQHSLNLMWNYPEMSGSAELWFSSASAFASDYTKLCSYFGTKSDSSTIPGLEQYDPKSIQIDAQSADSLFHIPDHSVDTIVTDPPYYSTIQYAEMSDFFYVWQKRTLGNVFPCFFPDLLRRFKNVPNASMSQCSDKGFLAVDF